MPNLGTVNTTTSIATSAEFAATKLDDLAAPDDNTDLNATTGAHGLLPKLGGGSTNFLRADGTWNAPAGGSGAPDTADYLVGTAQAGLSAEIVVGATPGGELGGTWAAPTVDATHSGTSHAGLSGQPGSTDVAVADGGTGASTAAAARTNLGVLAPMAQRTGVLYPGRCSGVTNNQADTLNVLQAYPFDVPVAATYDRMAVTVATSVASTLFRMGIYTDNGGKPDVLILDAGQLNCAAGGDLALTISQALSAGTVWLAGVAQGVAPSLTHATGYGGNGLGTAGGFSLPIAAAYSQTGITGALPNPWGATLTGLLRMPIIYLRAT